MYAYQWAGVSSCLLVPMSRSSSLCPKDHCNERMYQDLEQITICFLLSLINCIFLHPFPNIIYFTQFHLNLCHGSANFLFLSRILALVLTKRCRRTWAMGPDLIYGVSPLLTTWRARPLETKRVWSNLDFFLCLTLSVVRWTCVGGGGALVWKRWPRARVESKTLFHPSRCVLVMPHVM
ncbi:hypothetical protein BO85DRAFT_280003 [Aspergillus piperis CBS 112811]|uniref:Uncharacterized protein n=1 Tax=Aspergillus piperis CBS 112811 TaxID=1448313 RepID=A0A8G1VMC2_9EURO|nr:hypothetical protein BO85DRAFT_280003 [Aspergillus piperis CBS 112811]RAH58699.1 hypothetical protein BO85DRAFT_280003 [Aspergillus piperis CBS 112811]